MIPGSQYGTLLPGLSLEVRGEASSPQPTVLSCGGIFIPSARVPLELRTWKQIINLPGPELSAKIFGYSPRDLNPEEGLVKVLKKDCIS